MRRKPFVVTILLVSMLAPNTIHRAGAQSGSATPVDKSANRRPVSGGAEMLPDAPDFELKTLDGKAVHLRDFRGKAVLLNFWATWCVSCKEEMPWLIAFQKQYGPKGLVVLGIAMDETVHPIRKFTAKMKVNYPVLIGEQRIADLYYVKGLPASIFIDSNGRITDQVPGAPTRSFLENEIQLALENGTQPAAQ